MLKTLSQLIMRKILFLVTGMLATTSSFAQNLQADFGVSEIVCIGENISPQNNSEHATSYLWNFCSEDLLVIPTVQEVSTIQEGNGVLGIAAEYTNQQIGGLITSYFDNKLFGFISNQSEGFIYTELATSTILRNPDKIKIIEEDGKSYALLANTGSNSLVRLSLSTTMSAITGETELTGLGLDKPRGLAVIRFQDEVVALVGNRNSSNVTVLNFGNSITNDPTSYTINTFGSLVDIPLGLALAEEDGALYGLVASRDNGKIVRISFNSDLFTDPTFEAVATLPQAAEIKVVQEGSYIQAFVVDRNGRIHRLDFTNGLNNDPQVMSPIVDNLNNLQSLDIVRQDSLWIGFTIDQDAKKVYQLIFQDNTCSYTSESSLQNVNPRVSYNIAGTHAVNLTAYDEFGNRDDITQFITVTDSQAPSVDFQVSSQCIGKTITFTSITDQPLTSATWSINNETFSGETLSYNFTTPGSYEVTLEIESQNGCNNHVVKELVIYSLPSFIASSELFCTNGSVDFFNNTEPKESKNSIDYQWFITDENNNEVLVSEEADLSTSFATEGTYTIRLEAGIPGCTETVEQTINVLQGPTVSFTVPTVCQSNAVTFENQTVGADITGYFWEFGDGGTYSSVTAESPSYTFATPGTYPVALRVTNAQGCQNVYQQSVTVYSQPTVSFLSEVACAGSPTQFTDASTAGTNANVSAWQWDFGDGIGTASTRNPTYAYRQAGTYAVKLITTSTAGCVDSTVQTITVQSAVDVGFAAVRQCPTEAQPLNVLLSDTSVVAAGETIDRWFWTVNGNNFVSAEVEYAFPAPGDYPVSLTVFTASGCNATVQRIVTVSTAPAVAFTSVGSCTGASVAFQGEVDAPGWGELSYAWEFVGPNGEAAGNAATANPEVAFETSGTYAVTLTVQTDGGCSFSTTRSVTIAATPQATFTAAPDYGGTPLEVTFVNATTDATAYAWDFGGIGTSEKAEPTFTFTAVGTYVVTLVATNAAGCASTTQQTVEVVLPVQDLRLDDFTVADSPTGDGQQLVLTISNRGTRVASGVTVTVDLDETLTVEERRTEPLLPGQTVVYVTKFRLPTQQRNQQRPLRYLCARIAATDADFAEAQLDNNRNCRSLNEQLNVEPPFPNPASEQLRVSVILPEAEAVSLRLLNQDGRVVRTHRQEATLVGLNTFLLDVQGLPVGAYLLQVSYQGEQRQFRVAVGR